MAGPQFYGGPDLQRAGFWRAWGRIEGLQESPPFMTTRPSHNIINGFLKLTNKNSAAIGENPGRKKYLRLGKRQNADPRSVNYLRGPGPWTTFVDHGPLQWTTLVDHLRDTRFWGFEFLTVHGKMCSSRVQSLLSLCKLYTKCEVLNPFTI